MLPVDRVRATLIREDAIRIAFAELPYIQAPFQLSMALFWCRTAVRPSVASPKAARLSVVRCQAVSEPQKKVDACSARPSLLTSAEQCIAQTLEDSTSESTFPA